MIDNIQDQLWSLREYPELGRDVSWLLEGLRRLSIHYYLIFYSVADSPKSLIVERVLHGTRDLEALFQEE